MKLNETPLVSVMIPYYNCGKYIAETLSSVAQQCYPHIEIIIVDDGSDAAEADLLDDALHNYPQARLLRHENRGVAAARNTAAQVAKGHYYLFLDADDLILPDYISECAAVLERRPDCQLVYSKAEFFDARTGPWKLPQYENLKKLLEGNHIPILALHRAEDFHRSSGFDENLKSHEDWDLWIRMLKHGGEAHRINRVLFRYRRRQDQSSLSNRLMGEKQAADASWQKVYIKHSELFTQHGLGYHELISELKRYRRKSLLGRLTDSMKKCRL